ncbi:MAG: hypothetical protein KKH52_01600 [Nanoarchaeota archaeon]|nr:hypothetical protein [Nanoarchaeota archaeon]MBU1623296.1 hypothetical protein [Nanoarchaeota archaeon]MBU1974068.1 hypothetical protein [Nanoarchaeota archaeon]
MAREIQGKLIQKLEWPGDNRLAKVLLDGILEKYFGQSITSSNYGGFRERLCDNFRMRDYFAKDNDDDSVDKTKTLKVELHKLQGDSCVETRQLLVDKLLDAGFQKSRSVGISDSGDWAIVYLASDLGLAPTEYRLE